MLRSVRRLFLSICVLAAVPTAAHAQLTATYHLHNEASSTAGLKALRATGPDSAPAVVQSAGLRNQPPGAQTLIAFDTPIGVPGRGGVLPIGSTVTFTAWMRKTAAAGIVFPQFSLGINYPVATEVCHATGGSLITILPVALTMSCTTTAPIVMNATDRLTLTVGFVMAAGPGNRSMSVVLDIEGAPNGFADSRVVAPNPQPPIVLSLMPDTGGAGTMIMVIGARFGPMQGASTLKFNGVAASPASWTNFRITAPVPPGATTGPVVVTVGGAASNSLPFTVPSAPGPTITAVTPSSGHFTTPVTIDGANFGSSQGTSIVTFNGVPAEATAWSDNTIATSVPPGTTTGPLVVTVNNQPSNAQTFVIDQGTGAGLLEISSPADGSVLAPGQTVNVTVSSPDNSTLIGVYVLADGQLEIQGDVADTLPAQFALTIPATIDAGKYSLNAIATTWTGARASASIEIDVERPDMPVALIPQLRQIVFQAGGEQASIDLAARFEDDSVQSVRESTNVTYASADPAVATVDAHGLVTAVAEGDVDVVATYGPSDTGISVTIPVSVPPALIAAVPPAIDFGSQAIGTSSTQQMTITNVSDDELSMTGVTASGDYSETDNCVAASPLAPGASCSIDVTFAPTAAGPRPGAIGVRSTFHIVPVAFAVTGTGVSQ